MTESYIQLNLLLLNKSYINDKPGKMACFSSFLIINLIII